MGIKPVAGVLALPFRCAFDGLNGEKGLFFTPVFSG
jgi:hypothetical protein